MSLLVKLKDRQTGQPVIADDDDNEFLNIINLLAGQDVGKSIRIVNSDPAFAAARFDQNAASGNILELFRQGSSRAFFNNLGDLVINHDNAAFALVNPTAARLFQIDVNNSGIMNAITEAGTILTIDLATRILTFNVQPVLPKKLITFSIPFRVDDPSIFPLNDEGAAILVRVPAITGAFLNKITIIRPTSGGGSHTAGGSVTFAARIFNSGTLGSGVSFDDTNNAASTPYTEDFADVAISEGNFITFLITARSGTISERNVSINIEGYRELH